MVIRNKPTFDPYSLTDFQAKDALKSGIKTWRINKGSCLSVALITALPALVVELLVGDPRLTLFVSALMIPQAVTAISPLIARDARGLRTDIGSSIRIMRERLLSVITIAFMISSVVAAPALILLFVGKLAAIGGLILGALAASPLALSLLITVTESVGMIRSIKRSLFLIRVVSCRLGRNLLMYRDCESGRGNKISAEAAIIGFIIEPLCFIMVSAWAHCIYISMTGR